MNFKEIFFSFLGKCLVMLSMTSMTASYATGLGARSHWKCPIGYFLADKMTATIQADLAKTALILAADAGLRVWSITTDGTTVNMGMFKELGCNFTSSYDSMITKFKHPSQDYFVYAILDPCHMLKLARNALADLKSFIDSENNLISWKFSPHFTQYKKPKDLEWLINYLKSTYSLKKIK